ncbi:MAG: hypothetical protein AVO39_00515 [delta proteobacterium MLS_D]|jgi:pimeloyl-ACP methyl ester carboxylesterase|nr:MAG: hypothetical protein AVO39_00515 [delta proteobacterium MLS_D]
MTAFKEQSVKKALPGTPASDDDATACAGPGVTFDEIFFKTSDGVHLRIIDFIPPENDGVTPVLVFVAGWISMISAWRPVLSVLTPGMRVLYVETREKRSARVDWTKSPDFSIPRMVLDLREILKELVPPSSVLFLAGSSLGSTVILDCLSRCRRKPELAVVIAPNAEFGIPRWFYPLVRLIPPAAYGLIKAPLKHYLCTYRIDSLHEREQALKYQRSLDWADPGRLKASALAMKGYSLWPKLSGIAVPVVIVAARTDLLHGVRDIERMARLIPDARMEIMESNRETHSEKAGRFILDQVEECLGTPKTL